jgi:hypothetical protein
MRPGERWAGRFVFDVLELNPPFALVRVVGIDRPVWLPVAGGYHKIREAPMETAGGYKHEPAPIELPRTGERWALKGQEDTEAYLTVRYVRNGVVVCRNEWTYGLTMFLRDFRRLP